MKILSNRILGTAVVLRCDGDVGVNTLDVIIIVSMMIKIMILGWNVHDTGVNGGSAMPIIAVMNMVTKAAMPV